MSQINDVKAGLVRLSFKQKIAYAMGDLGCCFSWALVNVFLMYFWTDVAVLPAASVGTMMLISKAWDAVNDPVIGGLADRTNSKWGRFRPWILFGMWPLLVLNVLCFTVFPSDSVGIRTAYGFTIYFLLVLAYTCINIPYSSMTAALTLDLDSRASAASYRMIFGFGSGFIVAQLLLPVVRATGGGSEATGFFWAAVIFSILAVGPFLWCFFGTREIVNAPVEKIRFGTMFKSLKGNTYAWSIVVAWLFIGLIYATQNAAKMYYFTYFVGNQEVFTTNTFFSFTGNIVGALSLTLLVKRFHNKRTLPLIGLSATFITGIIMYFLPVINHNVLFLYHVLTFIGGWGLGVAIASMYGINPDVTEYTQYKSKIRVTGFITSFTSFSFKVGLALSTAVVGWVLGALGYVAGIAQNPGVLVGINWFMNLVPAFSALFGIAALLFYKLDKDTYLDIVNTLGISDHLDAAE